MRWIVLGHSLSHSVLCLVAFVGPVVAQATERSPVPIVGLPGTQPTTPEVQRPNSTTVAIVGRTATEIDDELDYSPGGRVADG